MPTDEEQVLGCRREKCNKVFLSRAVERVHRKEAHDFVTRCLSGRSAYVRSPASSAIEMRVRKRVLHLELQLVRGKNFSFELELEVKSKGVGNSARVRVTFSSSLSKLTVKKSFAQIPFDAEKLQDPQRDDIASVTAPSTAVANPTPWIHTFVDLQVLVHRLYGARLGYRFDGVKSLQINAHATLRRVIFSNNIHLETPHDLPHGLQISHHVPLWDAGSLDDSGYVANASFYSQTPAPPSRHTQASMDHDDTLLAPETNRPHSERQTSGGTDSTNHPGTDYDTFQVADVSNIQVEDDEDHHSHDHFNPWESSHPLSQRRTDLLHRNEGITNDAPSENRPSTTSRNLIESTDSLLEEIEAQQRKIASIVDAPTPPEPDSDDEYGNSPLLNALGPDDDEDADIVDLLNQRTARREEESDVHTTLLRDHTEPLSLPLPKSDIGEAEPLPSQPKSEALYPDHPDFFHQHNPHPTMSNIALPGIVLLYATVRCLLPVQAFLQMIARVRRADVQPSYLTDHVARTRAFSI